MALGIPLTKQDWQRHLNTNQIKDTEMRTFILTIAALLISTIGFAQDVYQLAGGVNKSFSGADTTVFYKVNNQGTALAAYMLIQNGDTVLLRQNGDTLSLAHPDTSVDFFLLTEGDILNRGDYKYWDGDSWELFTGGTLDAAYDSGGAGAGRTITADAGAVEITGGLLVSDTLGIGTSTPTKTLDVEGTALIHNSDNSSMLFRGLIADTLLGVLPLSAYGAGAVDTTGDWMSFNYAGADNLANEQGVHNLLIRKSTGDFRLIKIVEDRVQIGVGNILTYPGAEGDVELQVASNNNNAEWRFRDKTSHWAVKDSLGVDIVTIGETNGLTYVDGNQSAGAFLVSDASGNASWQAPSYGEMGFGDSTRTIALTQNTPAWATNGNNDLWSTGALQFSNGVAYSNDSLIVTTAGIYFVEVQLTMTGMSGSTIELQVFKNGAEDCFCVSALSLQNNRTFSLTYTDITDVAANDVFQVFVENTGSGSSIDVINGKIVMHRLN